MNVLSLSKILVFPENIVRVDVCLGILLIFLHQFLPIIIKLCLVTEMFSCF